MRNRDYVTMNVYWFGLAFMWNALHPILLPAILLQFVPEALKNTYLGGLTFAGLILAMIVQPLAGGLSDYTKASWGRRRPWMLVGVTLSLFCLAGLGLADSYWLLLVSYLLLQICSNAGHGPAQGLIPDLVPEERLGVASGIKNLFDMGGLIIASLVAGQLLGDGNPELVFVVIGAVLALSTLVTLLMTPERPISRTGKSALVQELGGLLQVDLHQHVDYGWLIVSRLLILLGIYGVQTFAQYFIRDVLGAANPAEVTGNLMATIGIALTLLVFPAGLLSDRLGCKRLNIFAGGLAAVSIFLLLFVKDVASLTVVGALIGMATGIFVSANWALATQLIPKEEAGKYLGLSNIATAGAAALARLAGPLIDGLNALQPGAQMGYKALFIVGATSALLGTLLMVRIGRGKYSTKT